MRPSRCARPRAAAGSRPGRSRPGLQLRDPRPQLVCRLGALGGVRHLSLQRGDSLVALGDGPLVVGRAAYLRLPAFRALRLPLPFPRLRTLRVLRFRAAAIGLTVHVPPAFLDKAGKKNARTLAGTGIVQGRHKMTS